VLAQIRDLAGQQTPRSAVLLTTSPPTIKATQDGLLPIVTEIREVESLEELRGTVGSVFGIASDRIVGTFHNHASCLDVLPHDRRIFEDIDNLLGTKLHIIGSRTGIQFYCAGNGPAITGSRDGGEKDGQ